MEQTHIDHDFEIVIERRPVIFYIVSVVNGYNGKRRVETTPVSMIVDDECDAFDSAELVDGETVVDTIPAQPGHFETGYWSEHGGWEITGYEVPGIPPEDWMTKAIDNEKRARGG